MRRLEDFEGDWLLERRITHAGGAVFGFRGRAEFRREGDRLLCTETGTLTGPDGQGFEGTRSYWWHEGLRVTFDDGREFHTVPAEGGDASHWCDPDQYDVNYDFSDWPVWKAVWTVSGPRKDYVSETEYRRSE